MKIKLILNRLNEAHGINFPARKAIREISRFIFDSFKSYIEGQKFFEKFIDTNVFSWNYDSYFFKDKYYIYKDDNIEIFVNCDFKFEKGRYKKGRYNYFERLAGKASRTFIDTHFFVSVEQWDNGNSNDALKKFREVLNDFKSQYEEIKRLIYQLVTHEVTHVVQFEQKVNRTQRKIDAERATRSPDAPIKYDPANRFSREDDTNHPNWLNSITYYKTSYYERQKLHNIIYEKEYYPFSVIEIEANAKEIYSKYKALKKKGDKALKKKGEDIGIENYIYNYIDNWGIFKKKRLIDQVFYVTLIYRYIYNHYPDSEIDIERCKSIIEYIFQNMNDDISKQKWWFSI